MAPKPKNSRAGAAHQGVAIDCSASALAERVRALRADAVVHTCGPFQGQDYHVARACMAAGALSVRGAMPCMGLMTLAEFAEAVAVANLEISWRTFFK